MTSQANLSDGARAVLAALRANVESTMTTPEGAEWGCVYLDNARPAGMPAHAFAGYLSALESAGLYMRGPDAETDGVFGDVRLEDESPAPTDIATAPNPVAAIKAAFPETNRERATAGPAGMPTPRLPFDYSVIGYVSPGNGRAFVAVARSHSLHPFVAYEIGADGECVSGDYVGTRSEAVAAMIERAAASCGDFRRGLESAGIATAANRRR